MLENAIDKSSNEYEMHTVISVNDTITYGELLSVCKNTEQIASVEAEMLYMDAFEFLLEIATLCHDVTNNSMYLMCKSCAPMYDSLVSNILDLRMLDNKCVFIDVKNPINLFTYKVENSTPIWIAVHSHVNDVLFMLAPITIIGPAVLKMKDGQCVSKNNVISLWGEM